MIVDIEGLTHQCQRWNVDVDDHRIADTALDLLSRMPTDPRINLQWATGDLWQLSMSGKLIQAGSLEDCIIHLASRCEP